MKEVSRSPSAAGDLLEIWMFIAQDSPKHATRLLDRIDRACKLRADFPSAGQDRREILPGLRSFPVGKSVVFYRAVADGIEVLRVLHGARRISRSDFAGQGA
jgi:toxin ParE1/3/4